MNNLNPLQLRVSYESNEKTSTLEVCALACKGYNDEEGHHKTILLGDQYCIYPGFQKSPDYSMEYKDESNSKQEKTQNVSKSIDIDLKYVSDDITEILLLAYVSMRDKDIENIYDAYTDGSIDLIDTKTHEKMASISLADGHLANEVTFHVGTLFRKPLNKGKEKEHQMVLDFDTSVDGFSSEDVNEVPAVEVKQECEWDLAIFNRGSSTLSIPVVIESQLGGEVEYQ